jgi:hypothetical protein
MKRIMVALDVLGARRQGERASAECTRVSAQ